TRVPDTPANRRAFGSVGTADDSAGFPLVRTVIATACQGRATLAAVPGAADAGEQTLLLRMLKQHPEVFCAGRVFCLDRNFPGYKIIDRVRACGAHLVMRMKAGISLELVEWLPDGSYLAWLGKTHRRLVRVVEYDVDTADGVSELFCLATTLLDWQTYPAEQIAAVYPKRWVASETTIGENKTLVTDAGPPPGADRAPAGAGLGHQGAFRWAAPRPPPPPPPPPPRPPRPPPPGHRERGVFSRAPPRGDPVDDPDPGHRDHLPPGPGRRGRTGKPGHPVPPAHPRTRPPQRPHPQTPAPLPTLQDDHTHHPRQGHRQPQPVTGPFTLTTRPRTRQPRKGAAAPPRPGEPRPPEARSGTTRHTLAAPSITTEVTGSRKRLIDAKA